MEVWPQPYEYMLYGLLQEEIDIKKLEESTKQPTLRFTPNGMLDEYIEICIKNKHPSDNRRLEDIYRENIRLLNLQLQYEKYRREIHAERNRRLLGKSRAIRALEQNNEALKDQVSRLTGEISALNVQLG
jgi:tuberous sclerosis protein 1